MKYTRFTILFEGEFSETEQEVWRNYFLKWMERMENSGSVGIEIVDEPELVKEAEDVSPTAP